MSADGKNRLILSSVLSYLKLPNASLNTINSQDEQLLTYNILHLLQNESTQWASLKFLDQVLIEQYLEYSVIYLQNLSEYSKSDIAAVLKDVNELLSDRVFVIGTKETIADLIFYEFLHPIMATLSISDKTLHGHLSRWFSHIQENDLVRQFKQRLPFSRSCLHA